MFVRFRKTPCDGLRPRAAAGDAAYIACRYPYTVGERVFPCSQRCRAKPRCRWRIGKDEALGPYRLKVYLVENKRVDGKVKQETVAMLGSIDATWLDSFYADIAPTDADKLKCTDWQLQSLRARTAFWKKANARLKGLANRLGPDLKRIRMAVHARVPWPMVPERKLLELLEAKGDFEFQRQMQKHTHKMIEANKKLIENVTRQNAELRADAVREADTVLRAAARVNRLSKNV